MVSKELSDSYEDLKNKGELYKKAKRFGNFITGLGLIILLLTVSFVIPLILISFGINIVYAIYGSILFGFLLLFIGVKFNRRKSLPREISIEKEEFIEVYESLKYIETYHNEKSDFLRTEIEKKLSKVERRIEEPSWKSYSLWEIITKEVNEDIRLLKKNIKERLLPNIFHENEEDATRAYITLENFAQYLLSPTISGLKDLNKSMLELTESSQKETRTISQLIPLFGHPYMRHIYVLIIIGFSSILVFQLGIGVLNVSIDNAYIAGTALFAALTGGYMAFMVRKS